MVGSNELPVRPSWGDGFEVRRWRFNGRVQYTLYWSDPAHQGPWGQEPNALITLDISAMGMTLMSAVTGQRIECAKQLQALHASPDRESFTIPGILVDACKPDLEGNRVPAEIEAFLRDIAQREGLCKAQKNPVVAAISTCVPA